MDAFIRNNGRYNLLESAIFELFEFIKVEDIRSLSTYVVENFWKTFDDVDYVQLFKHIKARYDQQQELLKEREKILDRYIQHGTICCARHAFAVPPQYNAIDANRVTLAISVSSTVFQ